MAVVRSTDSKGVSVEDVLFSQSTPTPIPARARRQSESFQWRNHQRKKRHQRFGREVSFGCTSGTEGGESVVIT